MPLPALRMAPCRRPAAGLVRHSDRGCQYPAAAYRSSPADHGLAASTSRTGDCHANARAESFFATLKSELIERTPRATRRAARRAVFEWIEACANRRRLHSALGYQSPVAFEEGRAPMAAAA